MWPFRSNSFASLIACLIDCTPDRFVTEFVSVKYTGESDWFHSGTEIRQRERERERESERERERDGSSPA